MKNLCCLILLTYGLTGFGQKRDTVLILPGSKILQSSLLSSYTATYDLFSNKDGEEKLVGSLEDHFQIQKSKHRGLRICKITFGSNQILDSGLCLLKGLTPVYHRSTQTRKIIDLAFSSEKVNGKIIPKTDEPKIESIDYKTSVPLFDSYYEDIIAKIVNLKKGTLFRFPEYIYERGGTVWSNGEVIQNDKDQSIIKFYELNQKNETVRTTTYIIKTSNREILQREYLLSNTKIVMKKRLL